MALAEAPATSPHELTPDEAIALVDEQAQRSFGMSGQEFQLAWDAGEFDARLEDPDVVRVSMLLPLLGR